MNLTALTEVHDALANVALANSLVSRGKYREAATALLDAEMHYNRAVACTEQKDSALYSKLSDLRDRITRLRSSVRRALAGREQTLRTAQSAAS
jgi:hypothetical protein